MNGQLRTRFVLRFALLQAVMPLFSEAAYQKQKRAKRFSSLKAFWTAILTPCLFLHAEVCDISQLSHQEESLLREALECLQSIVQDNIPDKEYGQSQFPQLETIRNRLRSSSPEDLILQMKFDEPTEQGIRSRLVDTLSQLEAALKSNSKKPPPEEIHSNTSRRPVMAPMLTSLLSTVSKYFERCRCIKPHIPYKALLLLFAHRTLSEKDSGFFRILFSQASGRWRETVIEVKEELLASQVQIVLPESRNIATPVMARKTPVRSLCTSIRDRSSSPLHLSVEGGALYQQLVNSTATTKILSQGISISLSNGLLENETELDMKGRICLATVLSYSLLDFCGEPWFPGGWTRDGIYLLRHGQLLSLRPALVTRVVHDGSSNSRICVTNDLRLLYHGILLMEIFRQEALPIDLSLNRNINVADLRTLARDEFAAMEASWDVCERYKQSVEACIEGLIIGDECDDDEGFARTFCQNVIDPLETDYMSLWGDRDLDEVISELKMPIVKPPPRAPKPPQLQTFRPSSGASVRSSRSPQPHVRFFDTIDSPSLEQVKGSEAWFKYFEQNKTQAQLPKTVRDRRLRIAVLDTGIDFVNPFFASKSGRFRCWPSKEACVDTDGHGTQVAYLLMRLAPHAHLRIAKIAKSQLLDDADIEQIASAISYFSSLSKPEDRVDIINMSFGFPQYEARLEPILKAIRAARANNVLFFAAAGNDGGNQSIFWPAKLHEEGDVICINSSDSEGNASRFNPTTGFNNRICTLGEALPSCQLNAQREIIYRSGTSFATPIAVAIAAIVLGIADAVLPEDMPPNFDWLRKERLRTKAGMEKILCTMCVLPDQKRRQGYSYITPWFFLNHEKEWRKHELANELRSML